MPCRSLGLLQTSEGDLPIRIPPRGKALHEARQDAIGASKLVNLIFQGGVLTAAELKAEARFFSVNAILDVPKEHDLLVEAFLNPFIDNAIVRDVYRRFLATSHWVFEHLRKEQLSSSSLICKAYRQATERQTETDVAIAWAEYEVRRRVHFALELLLEAFTDTLMDLDGGTVESVIDAWTTDELAPPILAQVINGESLLLSKRTNAVEEQISNDLWRDSAPPITAIRSTPAWCKAIFAFVVLSVCKRQTESLRASGRIPNRSSSLERTFSLLNAGREQAFSRLYPDLAKP